MGSRHNVAFYENATGDPVSALVTAIGIARDASAAGWPSRQLERAVGAMTGAAIAGIVSRGLAGEVPDAVRTGRVGLLLDAAEGSEAALAQVPAEVRGFLRTASDPAAEAPPES